MSTLAIEKPSKPSEFNNQEGFADVQKTVRAARRKVMASLRKMFEPHMWESGYRTGPADNRHAMKVWTPKGKDGTPSMVILNGQSLTEFWGYSEIGIITDAYGGGCVTQPLADFSLEDLMMLHEWGTKQFAKKAPSGTKAQNGSC